MQANAAGVTMTALAHGLDVRLSHGPSASELATAPPKDNGGTGAAFSPTDLVGAALAACALTTMALAAAREGRAWGDAGTTVVKVMGGPPRRIAGLALELRMPAGLAPSVRARYEEIARGCPVARSLGADVRAPMSFVYSAAAT